MTRIRTRENALEQPDYMGWGGIITRGEPKRRPPETPRPDEPKRARSIWTEEEDARLIDMLKAGDAFARVAEVLQRTPHAIATRAHLPHIGAEWKP